MDQTKQEEEYGYDLFPERKGGKYKKGSIAESLFTFNNKCQVMLQFAVETSEYWSYLTLTQTFDPLSQNLTMVVVLMIIMNLDIQRLFHSSLSLHLYK